MTNLKSFVFGLALISSFISSLYAPALKADAPKEEAIKADSWSTLEEYYSSLDSSCLSDSDCVVTNVGNCCGGYMRCFNRNAKPNTAWVQKYCQSNNMASICGMPHIVACKCQQQKCTDQLS